MSSDSLAKVPLTRTTGRGWAELGWQVAMLAPAGGLLGEKAPGMYCSTE